MSEHSSQFPVKSSEYSFCPKPEWWITRKQQTDDWTVAACSAETSCARWFVCTPVSNWTNLAPRRSQTTWSEHCFLTHVRPEHELLLSGDVSPAGLTRWNFAAQTLMHLFFPGTSKEEHVTVDPRAAHCWNWFLDTRDWSSAGENADWSAAELTDGAEKIIRAHKSIV